MEDGVKYGNKVLKRRLNAHNLKNPKKIPTQTRKVIYLYILLVLLRCNFGGVILWVVKVEEGKCVLFCSVVNMLDVMRG